MKNFNLFILSAICLIAISCNNQQQPTSHTLNLDNANLLNDSEYDTATHRVTYLNRWTSWGWEFSNDSTGSPKDFSEYDELTAVIENISTDTTTLYLNVKYSSSDVTSSASAPIVNGKVTIRLALDPASKSSIEQVYVMSKRACEMTVKDITFSKEKQYGPEKQIKVVDSYIEASEFDGYSDDAFVSFNYETKGEMTFVSDSGTIEVMNNWGIGVICSAVDVIEAICPGQRIMVKTIGKQSFTCHLGDIRYMLDLKDDDGEQGLYWVVWTGGNLTEVNPLDVTIKEVIK